MRGQKECNCGQVDPLLATVSGAIEESDEDEELEYEDAEVPGTTLLNTGIVLVLTTCLARTESSALVAVPGRFPKDLSPLWIIEDSEYVAPPVAEVSCGCTNKENEVPVQVPLPVLTPVVLQEQAVHRSPRSLTLGRPKSPYPLRPIAFSGARTSGRPVAYFSRSTYTHEHSTGKIRPWSRSSDVGQSHNDSAGGSNSDGSEEYGPNPRDYDCQDRRVLALRVPGLPCLHLL